MLKLDIARNISMAVNFNLVNNTIFFWNIKFLVLNEKSQLIMAVKAL